MPDQITRKGPVLKVRGLTETQVNAIGYGAEHSTIAGGYKITADDVYREATLAVLERKGYLAEKQRFGGHRWLTELGLTVKQDFDRAHREKNPQLYQG